MSLNHFAQRVLRARGDGVVQEYRQNRDFFFVNDVLDPVELEAMNCFPPHIGKSNWIMQSIFAERTNRTIDFVQKILA